MGLGAAWWNLRFNLAWKWLPGEDKHVTIGDAERGEMDERIA